MAVIRVNKTSNYTVMSNYHFKDKMSLKAKGLLSLMLSLPDNWDYSINGLVAICTESETAIKSTLQELKRLGYLEIIKIMPDKSKSGRIEYIYDIYETPKQEGKKQGLENLPLENQPLEIQPVENVGQLNTNPLNTKEENTNKLNTKNNRRFTPPTLEEVKAYCYERNNTVDPEHFIDYYSSNGWKVGKNPMKDWRASIRTWERNGFSKPNKDFSKKVNKTAEELDDFYNMASNWAESEE